MTLDPTISIGEIINSLSFSAAAVALGFNVWQYKQNNRTNRAILQKDLYSSFFTDPELFDAWWIIDKRDEASAADVRNAANRLLGHCDVIAKLFEHGSLTRKEMEMFEYVLRRTYKHPAIKQAFEEVDDYSDRANLAGQRPFSSFRNYCVSNKFS